MVRSKTFSRRAWWSEFRCPEPGVLRMSTSSPSSLKKPSSRATSSGRSWIAFIIETRTFFSAFAMACTSFVALGRLGRRRVDLQQVGSAVLAREMHDVLGPDLEGREAGLFRLGFGVGDEHVLGLAELGRAHVRIVAAGVVPVLQPDLAVLIVELLGLGDARHEDRVVAVARGEFDGILVAARKPQRRVGTLPRLNIQIEVAVGEVFSLEVERLVPARRKEDLERLAVALARLVDVLHTVERGLDRRDAAPHA